MKSKFFFLWIVLLQMAGFVGFSYANCTTGTKLPPENTRLTTTASGWSSLGNHGKLINVPTWKDDVRIYSRLLSDGEISALAAQGGPQSGDCKGWSQFRGPGGSGIARDSKSCVCPHLRWQATDC
jgi:hypothetical protein